MIGRIRTVKPSVFLHGLLADIGELLGYEAKVPLAYIGLWCYTDRESRFEWKPRELKQSILPHYAVDFTEILNAFANAGLVVKYTSASRVYGWIPRFLDHQNINGRESPSTIPAPPMEEARAIYEAGLLRAQFHTFTRAELVEEPVFAGGAIPVTFDQAVRRAGGQMVDAPTTSAAERASASNRNDLANFAAVPDASGSRSPRHTMGREGNRREGNRTEGKGEQTPALADSGESAGVERCGAVDDVRHGESVCILAANHAAEWHRAITGREWRTVGPVDANSAQPAGSAAAGADRGTSEASGVVAGEIARLGVEPVQAVENNTRGVRSLPAVQGPRNAAAVRDRMATVFAEIQDGTRTRVKREQLAKLHAEVVFLYWAARFEHPRAVLDAKREARILARLKENDGDVSELLYALDGAYHDDHILARGRSAGGPVYDGIETVLRDRGQVERFSNTRKGFKAEQPHPALAKLEAAARGDGSIVNEGG